MREEVSKLLPMDAREMLVAASKVEGERERTLAIQSAIDAAKRRYPKFFKDEDHEAETE